MDFDQLQQALGLASSAVGMTGKAADTISSIKRLFEGGTKPDSEEAQRLLISLATDLTAANMMNVQLSAALKSLSQELHRQDEFEKEKARYELFKTPAGDHAFRLKENAANGQPIHFICPVCLNSNKVISYLYGDDYLTCQANRDHGVDFKRSSPSRVDSGWDIHDPYRDL